MTKPVSLWIAIILAGSLLLACQGGAPLPESPTPAPVESVVPDDSPATATPTPPPTPSPEPAEAETPQNPELVTLVHTWQGEQRTALEEVIGVFSEETGIEVELKLVPFAELRSQLGLLLARGNPPHLVILPAPRLLAEFASQGAFLDLAALLDEDQLHSDYGGTWLDLGRHRGVLYGIPLDVGIKSLVWYSPKSFSAAGYTIPGSWHEMTILTHRMVADGRTPWCVGFEHGVASGWVGSDWIEDILLRSAGPEIYDSWVAHEIPWTDPVVAAAWDRFGQIVLHDEYVLGGTSSVLTTTWSTAAAPLLETPPGCYMHRQGPWISDTFSPELLVGQDVDFFALPPIDSAYGTPMIGWASLLVMLQDTPQARDLLAYLAWPPPEAQGIWTARGWLLSPSQQVGPALEPDLYEDDLGRRVAEMVFAADLVRFDGSDLMPVDVQEEFWRGAMEYVAGAELQEVLERIEERAAQAYP